MTDDDRGGDRAGPRGAKLVLWRGTEWIQRSLSRFAAVRGTRQSAAISYYVLLSLFPLILVLASVAGLVLDDAGLRADFIEALTDALPITEAGASDLDAALRGVSSNAGTVGLVSLVTLIWTASGMMGAIRGSLDDIDPETLPRPFARGKLVNLIMLLIAALLLAASAGLTIATRVAREDVGDSVGLSGPLYEVGRIVVPIAVGTALLVLLLRWAPSAGPPARDSWPAALVGAVALWALSVGFAAFIQYFGSYNVGLRVARRGHRVPGVRLPRRQPRPVDGGLRGRVEGSAPRPARLRARAEPRDPGPRLPPRVGRARPLTYGSAGGGGRRDPSPA